MIIMLLSQRDKEYEIHKMKRMIVKTCDICHGEGQVLKEDGIYSTYTMCTCMKTMMRNIRLLDWGIPKKFLDDSKWNLKLLEDKPYYNYVINYVNNFQDNYDNGKGLFLYGPHGRGKSTIECVIGKLVSQMYNADSLSDEKYFTVAFSLFDDIIKRQFSKDNNDVKQNKLFLYKSDLLIIDNVGNETGKNDNQFSQRLLEMILRKRDNNCLPTIVSSNFNIDEIENEYNIDVKDFIIQNDEIVYVSGDNHRTMNKENNNITEDEFDKSLDINTNDIEESDVDDDSNDEQDSGDEIKEEHKEFDF